jgi:hypothetical protein
MTRRAIGPRPVLMSLLAALVGLFGLAGPSPASAATQIGETFDPGTGAFCSAPFTVLQSASPQALYAAPFAGVITSWSFRADALPPRVKLKVGRFAGGDAFTIVGESSLILPTPTILNTFPVRIPVHSADAIGLYVDTSGFCGRPAGGFLDHFRSEDTQPGTTATFTQEGNFQFDISAALEPDADRDGFGDETQDRCPSEAFTRDSCPDRASPQTTINKGPKGKIKAARKKAKVRVQFSSSEPGSSFQCALDRRRFGGCSSPFRKRMGGGQHTFRARATDPAGNTDPTPAKLKFRVVS